MMKRPLWSIFALVVIIFWIIMSISSIQGETTDFQVFLHAGKGDFSNEGYWFYYPAYTLPFFYILGYLSNMLSYTIWIILNALGFWYAQRTFRIRSVWYLVNYLTLASLSLGQVTGLVIAGVAMVYVGVKQDRRHLIGGGLLLALVKPHLTIVALLILLWPYLRADYQRVRFLIIPVLFFVISLIIYGNWPYIWWERLQSHPPTSLPGNTGHIELWQWIGPIAFLLWFLLLLPISQDTRFKLALLIPFLANPYAPSYDLSLAFVAFPEFAIVGNVALLVNLAFGSSIMIIVLSFALSMFLIAVLWNIYMQHNQDSNVVRVDNTSNLNAQIFIKAFKELLATIVSME